MRFVCGKASLTRELAGLEVSARTEEPAMSQEIKTGAVLIRENTLLPADLAFKSESCVPGWKIVTDFDGYALGSRDPQSKMDILLHCYCR
jgi:hypothetical protein